jgi:APA family basic amino acid/polyamine antiporter
MLVTIFFIALLYFLVQLAFSAVSPPVEGREGAAAGARHRAARPCRRAADPARGGHQPAGNLHANMTATPRSAMRWPSAATCRRGWPRSTRASDAPRLDPADGRARRLLALSGGFVWLAVVSTLARMVVYAVTIAAWLKIERRAAGEIALGLARHPAVPGVRPRPGAAWATLAALSTCRPACCSCSPAARASSIASASSSGCWLA